MVRFIPIVLPADALLRQFGHGKLGVPAVVSHVTVLRVELCVFEAVTAHFGVLVVDGVDEDKDDGDTDHRDCHQAGYEGQIVLWNEIKTGSTSGLGMLKNKLPGSPFLSCHFQFTSHMHFSGKFASTMQV